MIWRTAVRGACAGPDSWQPARRALGLRVRIGAVIKCWYVCKHVCIIDAAMTSLCSHSQYHHQAAAAGVGVGVCVCGNIGKYRSLL